MKLSLLDEFEWLSASVLEGDASREEVVRFNELIRECPELVQVYLEQLQTHAMLICRGGGMAKQESVRADVRRWGRQKAAGNEFRWRSLWKIAAAAAAILMTGAAMWYAADVPTACERLGTGNQAQTDAVLPAVRLIGQKGVKGLDLPATVPGTLRIESGEVVVRLQTGVELTLIGPASVAVESGMRVGLEHGRLLANVPHWATGFTVRTRELEIYDLGTVFGVQVGTDASDVFVFKGSVQVNEVRYSEWGRETSCDGVGICEAGEGVSAVSGESPVKIAADWPEAEKLFGSVQDDRAIRDPAKALATATRLADLWAERYMPGSNLVAKKVRIGNGIPFQKTAWVRSPATLQQETSNMNKTSAAAVLTAAVMMGAGTAGAVSDPVLVDLSPHTDNGRWTTVFTNEVPLQWDWPATAASAELSIVGMNGSFVTNFTEVTSNWLWRAFASDVPSAEDTYSLTLTFCGSGETVVGALTSRLSVVTGAFGETPVDPDPSGPKWAKVKENVLLPYDAGWTAATAGAATGQLMIAQAGGAAQTNALADAVGHFGWKLKHSDWGYGTFNLALTFPGTEGVWDATLTRVPDGVMFSVR